MKVIQDDMVYIDPDGCGCIDGHPNLTPEEWQLVAEVRAEALDTDE